MTIPGGQSSDEDDDDNATLTDQDLFNTLVPQGRARRGSAAPAPRPADTPDHTANNNDRSGITETPHDNDQPAPPETAREDDQTASPESRRSAIRRTATSAVFDDLDAPDALGRKVLAAHLTGLINQVVRGQSSGTAVVHIDGRWGAGKSTLVELFKRRLDASSPGSETAYLHEPVMVRYDAWRESSIAPEWWSLATAINRAVRDERALAARCGMTVAGLVQRLARSHAVLVAVALLVVVAGSLAAGVWKDAETLGKLLTTLTAIMTLGLVFGRALFWSSPAFGRLHVRTDDNPLGHVANVVAAIRRWSPRHTMAQRIADTALALWIVATAGWAAMLVMDDNTTFTSPGLLRDWTATDVVVLTTCLVATVLVLGMFVWGGSSTWTRDARPSGALPTTPLRANAAVRALTAAAVFAVLLVILSVPPPGPLYGTTRGHPAAWITGVLVVGLIAFALATRAVRKHPRRPLVLLVDDLDRCPADRVVKLLETIHTLLREPVRLQLLTKWRTPAPFVVLVLADARWIRAAFEEVYKPFIALGTDVHSLGADFVQKVFDHTVLVPPLSARQLEEFVSSVTRPATDSPDDGQSAAVLQHVLEAIEQTDAGDLRTGSADDLVRDPALSASDVVRAEAARAEREATAEATSARADHLLTAYADLMPANPRLVKRIANTMGMLFALKSHLGHEENEDTIARAAIIYIRFPRLVDELVSAPEPPVIEHGSLWSPDPGARSAWHRGDVRQVLGDASVEGIARCYGRTYPPPATTVSAVISAGDGRTAEPGQVFKGDGMKVVYNAGGRDGTRPADDRDDPRAS